VKLSLSKLNITAQPYCLCPQLAIFIETNKKNTLCLFTIHKSINGLHPGFWNVGSGPQLGSEWPKCGATRKSWGRWGHRSFSGKVYKTTKL